MAQHFEDHIVRGIHRHAMSSGTAWPSHVVRALCEDLIRLRGTDRPWLAANPPEDENGPRCGDVCFVGGAEREFVVCEKRAGHAADLYHLDGEWRWMTGEAAERFERPECLCFGVGGRRVPPSRQPCPRHGDQATWEGADELTVEAERLGLDYFGENDG